MKFSYEVETKEALIRLRDKTIADISEIDSKGQKMRDEIGEQLAIGELYFHRSTLKNQKGWETVISDADKKANELEQKFLDTKMGLDAERLKLQFDLESLNEMLGYKN